ncbi:MAG: helix-turn-helix transcriptional regulator [Acetatifactor sp.]
MLQVDFVGYNAVHPDGFVYDIGSGHDFFLLVLTSSPAEFLVDGQFHSYPAGSVMLYTPGSYICYKSNNGEYRNDWIRFRTNESFVQEFPFQNTPFPVSDPEYCHHLIKLITWESSLPSPNSELILSHLFNTLFLKLHDGCGKKTEPSAHDSDMLALRKRIYNNPQLPWNVSQMAEELHLSAGYFQTLYKHKFNVSCMDDVIEGRLRLAKDHLVSSGKSILEIAEACGYRNVEHFCRQFRQYAGCSPSQYRRNAKIQNPSGPAHRTLGGLAITQNDLKNAP